MNKKNVMIMISITVLLLASVLLSADIIDFSKQASETAHNLQGQVIVRTYNFNSTSYIDSPANHEQINIRAYSSSGALIYYTYIYTDQNGNYYIDFPTDILGNIAQIEVIFRGSSYTADFDVNQDSSIRIDILWYKGF